MTSIEKVSSLSGLMIEDATWHDFSGLNRLEKRCFRPEDVWPFWDLIGILTLPGLMRLKAVVEEKMVGFIGGEREHSQGLGWVTTLAVLPDYRRQGVARALLLAGEKALDMPRVRLSVRASNHAAIQLYERAGYQIVDRWQGYYAGGEAALVLEKKR